MKSLPVTLAAVFLLASTLGFGDGPPPVVVRVAPDPAYIERTPSGQYLSCDFFLTNNSGKPLEVTDIRAKEFTKDGTLVAWRKIDSNGSRPSVEVLGPRRIEPGATLTLFNPFDSLETDIAIDHVSFEFRFDGLEEEVRAYAEVRPAEYKQAARLILPVAGATLFAYDGPGLYSHHRRIDVNEPFNRDVIKLHENSQRYALDLVVLDRDGSPFHGNPMDQKTWAGFGHPIVAPAGGTILEAVADLPDDIPYDVAKLKENPALMAGNHVMIDHGNGEFSLLCHFRSGSVKVRVGQRVRRGDVLGEMGHSGMGSGLVHVHYELRNSSDLFNAEGLPARFEGFRRSGAPGLASGRIGAGAIVVTEPAPAPGH